MRNLSELEIEGSIGSPASEEIRAIEKQFGVELPATYIEFMMVANGGDIGTPCFDYDLPGNRSGTDAISTLFTIGDDREDQYSVWDNWDNTVFLRDALADIGLENKVVALAENGGGDVIYLDFAETTAAVRILYRTSQNSRPIIARSFEEFVDKLYLSPGLQ